MGAPYLRTQQVPTGVEFFSPILTHRERVDCLHEKSPTATDLTNHALQRGLPKNLKQGVCRVAGLVKSRRCWKGDEPSEDMEGPRAPRALRFRVALPQL